MSLKNKQTNKQQPTVDPSVLTWSSRYSLIGMYTEAQVGIPFRASVGMENLA
jgi:hypothetical protein